MPIFLDKRMSIEYHETMKIKEIKAMAEREGRVFVRWSRSPEKDVQRGYSLDHGSGRAEPGLSVQVIKAEDVGDPIYFLDLLLDYGFCRINGARCWVAEGRISGSDSDGCPTIADAKLVAMVDGGDLKKADRIRKAYKDAARVFLKPPCVGWSPNGSDAPAVEHARREMAKARAEAEKWLA